MTHAAACTQPTGSIWMDASASVSGCIAQKVYSPVWQSIILGLGCGLHLGFRVRSVQAHPKYGPSMAPLACAEAGADAGVPAPQTALSPLHCFHRPQISQGWVMCSSRPTVALLQLPPACESGGGTTCCHQHVTPEALPVPSAASQHFSIVS